MAAIQHTIDWDLLPRQLAQQGEQRAYDAAPTDWKSCALEALRIVCEHHELWIVDQVWTVLDTMDAPACPEKRAMAGVLSEGCKRGWCERTRELKRSQQPQCHSNLRSVYRSLMR